MSSKYLYRVQFPTNFRFYSIINILECQTKDFTDVNRNYFIFLLLYFPVYIILYL